jgi:hypothetical protein
MTLDIRGAPQKATFEENEKWYFFSEDWKVKFGPYDTQLDAIQDMNYYEQQLQVERKRLQGVYN